MISCVSCAFSFLGAGKKDNAPSDSVPDFLKGLQSKISDDFRINREIERNLKQKQIVNYKWNTFFHHRHHHQSLCAFLFLDLLGL